MHRIRSVAALFVLIASSSMQGYAANLFDLMNAGKYAEVLKSIESSKSQKYNKENKDGTTILLYAIREHRLDLVKALIAKGADLAYKNSKGLTPMADAVDTYNENDEKKRKSLEIVRALFEGGASPAVVGPSHFGETGRTALGLAFHCGDLDLAKRMVDKGADINADDAVMEAYHDDMERLFSKPSDDGFRNIRYLLSKGLRNLDVAYDRTIGFNSRGMSSDAGMPLVAAMSHWFTGKTSDKAIFLQDLLSRGWNPFFASGNQLTPLHFIAAWSDSVAMKALLDSGGSSAVDALDWNGRTPLWYAALNDSKETGMLLLEAGADPNAGGDAGPATVYCFNEELLKEMVKRGGNVNAANVHGVTSLFAAVGNKRLDVAKMLVANGADPTMIAKADKFFRKAEGSFSLYDYALASGNKELIAWVATLRPEFAAANSGFAAAEAIAADPAYAKVREFAVAASKKDWKGALAAFDASLDLLKEGDPDQDAVLDAAAAFEARNRGTDAIANIRSGKYDLKVLDALVWRAQAEKIISDLGQDLASNAKCASIFGRIAAEQGKPLFARRAAPDQKQAAEFASVAALCTAYASAKDFDRIAAFAQANASLPFSDKDGNDLLMLLLLNRPRDNKVYSAYYKAVAAAKAKVDFLAKNKEGRGALDIVRGYQDRQQARLDAMSAEKKPDTKGASVSEKAAAVGASGQSLQQAMYEREIGKGIEEALLK